MTAAKTKTLQLTATKMRLVLSSTLFLIISSMIGGFYFAYTFLSNVASEVSEAQTVAESSSHEINRLTLIKDQLSKYSLTAERSEHILADQGTYQNQLINDLTNYARQSGVEINSFAFHEAGSNSATSATSENSETTSGDGTEGADSSPSASTKSAFATIQLSDSLQYTNLVHFIYLIENSLTRMQISNLPLSRNLNSDGSSPINLEIEVHIR